MLLALMPIPSRPSKAFHPHEWRWAESNRRPNEIGPEGHGDKETRTPDSLLAKQELYQLSYVPEVGVAGFEPAT